MKKEEKKLLKLFQCDFNRSIEEDFAQVFTEHDYVRLFFINENQAFTDGQNIVVDPSMDEMFADKEAIVNTENWLKIEHVISNDPWIAMRMVTRAQNIHESLHIIYTSFPNPVIKDQRSSNKARMKTLSLIANIIEDTFIEAAGCSVYDNLELFLQFGRVSRLYANTPSDGTVDRAFSTETKDGSAAPKTLPLVEYLNFMIDFLLYPMIKQGTPDKTISKYIKKTKQLFADGSICGNPEERYTYTQKIFDIIEPLIPDSDTLIDVSSIDKRLGGLKTHSTTNASIGLTTHQGKTATITRRLFTDLDGNTLDKRDFSDQADNLFVTYASEKKAALNIVVYQGSQIKWSGTDFDCAKIHKDITIEEIKPKINLNLRKAYQNIFNRYHININSYNSRFAQLLKAQAPVREDKFLFGSGVASKRMGDIKKRYWYRNVQGIVVPDISIMLLIDGSGSMEGERRENAMISSVILHEVLKRQDIKHAIVEHRAIYDKPLLKHNILVDFNARDEEKYNILSLKAEEGTREGLSLFWAENYINMHTFSEEKLIIVISDGVPAHGLNGDGCYMPPVSIKDTANAVKKIIKRGTNIIAVALDDEESYYEDDEDDEDSYSCYDDLKEIYPDVVGCTDLKRLTGQLLTLISKQFC